MKLCQIAQSSARVCAASGMRSPLACNMRWLPVAGSAGISTLSGCGISGKSSHFQLFSRIPGLSHQSTVKQISSVDNHGICTVPIIFSYQMEGTCGRKIDIFGRKGQLRHMSTNEQKPTSTMKGKQILARKIQPVILPAIVFGLIPSLSAIEGVYSLCCKETTVLHKAACVTAIILAPCVLILLRNSLRILIRQLYYDPGSKQFTAVTHVKGKRKYEHFFSDDIVIRKFSLKDKFDYFIVPPTVYIKGMPYILLLGMITDFDALIELKGQSKSETPLVDGKEQKKLPK